MASLFMILLYLVTALWYLVLANVLVGWLINFDVLNPRQPLVHHIWAGLSRILEPIYRPLRRILPQAGGIDFSPMVVFLGLYALRIILLNNQPVAY